MPDPPRVRGEDTLDTAVELMEEHGHISIVMVGPRGRARGVIRLDAARRARRASSASTTSRCPGSSTSNDDLRTRSR